MTGAATHQITATCEAIARALETRKLRLCAEIDHYPAPVAPRDAHFNRLIEERAELLAELGRFMALRAFVLDSRSLDAESRQQLIAALHDANT
ncbi:MAG: hypothetical protein K2X06_09200 [Burkholderiales bacterium]|nr:hypothetical protein [Burkholderiales bacterium]